MASTLQKLPINGQASKETKAPRGKTGVLPCKSKRQSAFALPLAAARREFSKDGRQLVALPAGSAADLCYIKREREGAGNGAQP